MRRWCAVLMGVIGLLGLAGCGDDEPAPEPPGAKAYASVISRFLPPGPPSEEPLVVYVVPVNGEALPLDTQVGVIDALAEQADVRFVDEVAAAVDEDSSDQPPRDEGMLVGLGRFAAEPPYTIRVELYQGSDRVDGQLLTVRYGRGKWVVVDAETVTPEVLVGEG